MNLLLEIRREGPVEKVWNHYEETGLSALTGETQRILCRRSFYAGVTYVLGMLAAAVVDVPEEETPTAAQNKLLSDIEDDLDRFIADLERGAA